MVVNRSRRCSYRRLLPIWLIVFSIATCCATEAPSQNHNDEKLQFESEIDVRAEVLSSTQTYDKLDVEPSNLQTKLSVSEATEVTQTLSTSDDSVTSTMSQLNSDAVEEYEDRINDGNYKRSEAAEELTVGTTEQFKHSEMNEKQRVVMDSISVTITAAADDSSVTTATATSTFSEGQTMNSDGDVNVDINTQRQNANPSPKFSHSNDQEEFADDMAVDTTVDPLPVDTLIIKNTHNDDYTHKRTQNNDNDDDDNDDDNDDDDDDSSMNNSLDNNDISPKEIKSENNIDLQTESQSMSDDDYIDGAVEGVVDDDDKIEIDIDYVNNDLLKNHDSDQREGRNGVESDSRGSIANDDDDDDIDNNINVNDNENDYYDDDDINNNAKKDDDDRRNDSDKKNDNNQDIDSSDNDDQSYTDNHDPDTTNDSDTAKDNDNNSIDNNNNDNSNNNKNSDNNDDVKIPIDTSNTHNNTSTNTNNHIKTNTDTNTDTNTNTNEKVPLTALSASLDSRIKRLGVLIKERQDLVDDYNIHQMGKETIMNAMNRHIMKAMQHRPLLPSSDSTCFWNYWKERYVHVRHVLSRMHVRFGLHFCVHVLTYMDVHVCTYALMHIPRRFIDYSLFSLQML
jgi:hypothetical protein